MLSSGGRYARGEGFKRDAEEAAWLCTKAADACNSDVLVCAGACSEHLEGVERGVGEAVSLSCQAADAGHAGGK